MEWDGQSPTEGEGLFLDRRDSIRTGNKRTGEVAGDSARKPKFKIHGHQTQQKISAEVTTPGRLGPTQSPASWPLPPSTTNRPDSGKEKSTTITLYALFLKNVLLWTVSNKYKENRRAYSKHLSLSLNNY